MENNGGREVEDQVIISRKKLEEMEKKLACFEEMGKKPEEIIVRYKTFFGDMEVEYIGKDEAIKRIAALQETERQKGVFHLQKHAEISAAVEAASFMDRLRYLFTGRL